MKQSLFGHKKFLSLVLSAAMLFSMLPSFTYAEEDDDTYTPPQETYDEAADEPMLMSAPTETIYVYLQSDPDNADMYEMFFTSKSDNEGYTSADSDKKWALASSDEWYLSNRQVWSSYAGKVTYVKIGDKESDDIVIPKFMAYWFYGFSSLEKIDTDALDASNVSNMSSAFQGCTALTQIDISQWNACKASNIQSMFRECILLESVNVSNVGSNYGGEAGGEAGTLQFMQNMFDGCTSLTEIEGLENWDVTNAYNTDYMFRDCTSLTKLDLSKWNMGVSSGGIYSPDQMFKNCKQLKDLSIGSVNAFNAYSFSEVFSGCSSLTDINLENWTFNNNKLETVSNPFADCTSLVSFDGGTIDMGKVTTFEGMFGGCTNLKTVDLSGWTTSSLTHMSKMFKDCTSLTEVDLGNFDLRNLISLESTFSNCSSLESVKLPETNKPTDVVDTNAAFSGCSKLTEIDLSGWKFNKSKVLTANDILTNDMFRDCTSLQKVDFTGCDFSAMLSTAYMFHNCGALTEIKGDLDFPNVCDAQSMFGNCTQLKTLNAVFSQLMTAQNMFANCQSLESLDVSEWNTSNLIEMSYMFYNCRSLTELNVKDWDTSNVGKPLPEEGSLTIIPGDSGPMRALIVRPSGFMNTFRGCENLTSLDLSNWSTDQINKKNENTPTKQPSESQETFDARKAAWDAENASYPKFAFSGFAAGCPKLKTITIGANFGFEGMPTSGMFYVYPEMKISEEEGKYTVNNTYMSEHYQWTEDNRGGISKADTQAEKVVDDVKTEGNSLKEEYDQGKTDFTNNSFTATNEITSSEKDTVQKNYTSSATYGSGGGTDNIQSYIMQSASWEDYANGKAKLSVDASTAIGYGNIPLYVFTICTAHGFDKEKAQANIEFLAENYKDGVDVLIIDDAGIIRGPFRFKKGDDDTYKKDIQNTLDGFNFITNTHYFDAVLAGVKQYIFGSVTADLSKPETKPLRHPAAIYVSLDNVLRQMGLSGAEKYVPEREFYQYLADNYDNEDDDRYFSMASAANYEKPDGDCADAADPYAALVPIISYTFSPRNYLKGIDDGRADTMYDKKFEEMTNLPIFPESESVSLTVSPEIFKSAEVDLENSYYTSTGETDSTGVLHHLNEEGLVQTKAKAGTGTEKVVITKNLTNKIIISFEDYMPSTEIHIELKADIKDNYVKNPKLSTGEDLTEWFNTSVGKASLRDNAYTLASVDSPVLARLSGDLTISKTVKANAAHLDADTFSFKLALTDHVTDSAYDGAEYSYTGSATGGVGAPADGSITVGGDAVTLKHGQSITIQDLPYGVEYTVTEDGTDDAKYNIEHQTDASAAAETGSTADVTIADGSSVTALFTNIRKYTLKYDSNGGPESCKPASVTDVYGSSADVADVKTGTLSGDVSSDKHIYKASDGKLYMFTGWSTNPNYASDPQSEDTFCASGSEVSVQLKDDVTLYAVWKQVTTSLAFEENPPAGKSAGDVTDMPSDMDNLTAGANVTIPDNTPALDGYTFKGWSKKAGASASDTDLIQPGGSIVKEEGPETLYAVWEKVYTLTFNKNTTDTVSDMPDPNPIEDLPAGMTVIPGNTPTRDGYTFKGWNTQPDGLGDNYAPNGSINIEEDTTLYAVWEKIPDPTYSLTYDKNTEDDVSNMPDKTENLTKGSTSVSNKTPTRDGYTFKGWNTKQDGSGDNYAPNGSINIEEDTTLYAVWEKIPDPTYSLTYDKNTDDDVSNMPDKTENLPKGSTSVSDKVPTRDGYTFKGWNTKQDGSGDNYAPDGSINIEEDTTLYAVWDKIPDPTYSLTYDKNTEDDVSNMPDKAENLAKGETSVSDKTPTRDGYTFKGWNTKQDGSGDNYAPNGSINIEEDTTLYAIWEENAQTPTPSPTSRPRGSGSSRGRTYTLTYETNGGDKIAAETYSPNTNVDLNKTPTRDGYTFDGWYSDTKLTKQVTSVQMTGNKTVYAKWTEAPAATPEPSASPEPAASSKPDTDNPSATHEPKVPDMLNGDDHFAYVVGYPDGNVRPARNITRAEVAAIFCRLLKEKVLDENIRHESSFTDFPTTAWYNTYVATMENIGIIKGRAVGQFAPDAPITRAEFAAVCARFDTSELTTETTFNDIAGHWAENDIKRAAALGWISGYGDGTFQPNKDITRAEAMTMINRVLLRIPETPADLLDDMIKWPDNTEKEWYYLPVQEATNTHDAQKRGSSNEKWLNMLPEPDWSRFAN